VVTIHVQFNTLVGKIFQDSFSLLCVPFFYITSLTYFVNELKEASVGKLLTKSWKRIALPYLVWSLVYVILLTVKSLITGGGNEFVSWRVLLYGESAVHLYFLPELIAMQLMTLGFFLLYNSNRRRLSLGLFLLSCSIGYYALGYKYNCFGVIKPLHIITYLVSALLLASKITKTRKSWSYIAFGLLLVSLTFVSKYLIFDSRILEFIKNYPIGGIGLMLLALGFPLSKMPNWLSHLSSLTFGIYLSHIVVLEALEFFFDKILLVNVFYTFEVKLLATVIIFMLASLFTLFIRKVPLLSQTLLGEKR
jgi:surface polysaccharide O-acyltransferase-like enzyme